MQRYQSSAIFISVLSRYETIVFPGVFIIAIFISYLGGIVPTLLWLISMPFHECGHALIYWLRGIPAVPAFGLTVTLSAEFVLWFFLLLFAALTSVLIWAWRTGSNAIVILSGTTLILTLFFSFVLDSRSAEIIAIYFGQGGELMLSALACISFYAPWSKKIKFQQWRYALLLFGALTFVCAFRRWIGISYGSAELPMGALIDFGALEGGDSSGDMDRLLREFGWTKAYLISVYSKTAWLSAIAIVTAYLVQPLLKQHTASKQRQ